MTTTVTMLQTRLGENGSLWTIGNSYAASDAFAAVLISSNLATGTLPKSRGLVPLWGQTDNTGAVASVVDAAGNTTLLNVVHPRYWFHGCAALQAADDGVFRDMVAGNNGAFGVNLSRAQAWANRDKGYISNIDPVGGSTDSVIRIPGPNWDYANGESLLIMWSGQVTPEGSDADLMGTSNGTGANGIRVRANANARLSFVLYDTTPTSAFSTTSTDNAAGKPFVAGELHSFALFIDGQNRQQSFWVDSDINVSPLAISAGVSVNTLSSATWNIGTASPAGGTIGIAAKTLAFAGLKFLATDTLPTTQKITAAVQAFNRDPRGLILAGAL